MAKLTDKQEMFCREYIVDLNATQAAIRAGYSEKTANRIASDNLSKVVIQERIAELMKERSKKVDVSAQYVLERLHQIDQLDVLDIMKDDLTGFRLLSEWPKSWRISINAIDIKRMVDAESVEAVIEKIKWPDKTKNLELLGKHVDVSAFSGESLGDDTPVGRIQIEVVGANSND